MDRKQGGPTKGLFRGLLWACLLTACLGTSWFAAQIFLLPQPRAFTPDWQDARWIGATDTTSPVAYFRYAAQFDVLPDNAFITVTANQVFRLYVNGIYIGSNTTDFVQGNTPQTYMFDIDATLLKGLNVVGLRVANVDTSSPLLRATLGVQWGNQVRYYSTGHGWLATGDTALAHPRNSKTLYDWSKPSFDASAWRPEQSVTQPAGSAPLLVNPQIYQRPMPSHWISAGAGQESYYVRQISMPAGFDNALLRIVATGEADIFINDHLYMRWNGQVNVPQTNVVNYLTDNGQPAPYRNGLMLGVYDVSPYLHPGTNTLAVHILAPGTTTAKVGLDTLKSALALDMLVSSAGTYSNPLASDSGWHAASTPVPGWTHASEATFGWAAPEAVGRPGASHTFYLPDSNTPRSVQVVPPALIGEVIAWSCAAVLACWLLTALVILRRFYHSRREALAAASLIFLPALACEALLVTLSRQPQLPQPFPYTWQWGLVLLVVVGLSTLALWRHARGASTQALISEQDEDDTEPALKAVTLASVQRAASRKERLLTWLKYNWGLMPIILLAIPMVCYNVAYEPYWQDELSSYYAARHIMAYGFPAFPSGFIYPKGELFSYLLALVMSIFGTTSAVVPRTISIVCFLASLPILYLVGSKLFNRRIAWLATAMLAFSPYDMIWSRQTRMYELAQFMVIVVLFTLYRAIQQRDKIAPVSLAVLSLLVAYFSHEEVFIILPAVVICALLFSREGPYGIPAVLRKKHWWIAALIAGTIIAIQLSAVFLSHPPQLGSDQSQRPQIQLTTDNIPYYFNLLFTDKLPKDGPTPWVIDPPFIALNSILAVLGCVLAFVYKERRARYCATILLLSSLTLIFVFTMQADRYYYPLLPVYYLLGAYACWKILEALWLFARPYLATPGRRGEMAAGGAWRLPVRLLVTATLALLCASVLLVPMLPLSNFNLFVSRVVGVPYHRHYADYDEVQRYMQSHMQEGDIVITVAPAVSVLYYVGRVDHFFSVDRALFLFERAGRMVETTSGAHPLLNQADFQTVLAQHNRIWLISDNGGYQGGVTKDGRFVFPPPDFRLVHEGYGSAIYFRSAP